MYIGFTTSLLAYLHIWSRPLKFCCFLVLPISRDRFHIAENFPFQKYFTIYLAFDIFRRQLLSKPPGGAEEDPDPVGTGEVEPLQL
jgi:hypothetical protein